MIIPFLIVFAIKAAAKTIENVPFSTRAIETYKILTDGTSAENIILSISRKHRYFNQAMDWAKIFLGE